jgi:hypothetical protein
MKTIQLVILTLFVSISTFSNAQDASNNATWEETMDFLKENLKYAKEVNNPGKSLVDDCYISDGKITVKTKSKAHKGIHTIIAPLDKLKEANLIDKNIELFFGEQYVTIDNNSYIIKYRFFYLKFDSELNPRMLKAFQHLTYLNSERLKKSKL